MPSTADAPRDAAQHHGFSARSVWGAVGRGIYVALLATVGSVLVGLLRLAERRDERAGRQR